jgi:LPPG:FO 2-phospho-L-lactate transferase
MADLPCRTMLDTREHGTLSFQNWFVRHAAKPSVTKVWFDGLPPPSPGLLAEIEAAELVIIGPSNPYVSIDPILTLPGVRDAVFARPVVSVSPIVGGAAVKGPLATMIRDLAGEAPTAAAIARHYAGGLDAVVVEHGDERDSFDVPVRASQTVMKTRADSLRLAHEVLAFAESIA